MDYFTGMGGSFRYKARLQKILLGNSGQVEGFQLADGSTVTGDIYVSAMPGETEPIPCIMGKACLEAPSAPCHTWCRATHVSVRG